MHLHVRGAHYLPKYLAYFYAASVSSIDRLFGRPPDITPQVLRLLVTRKVLSSKRLREQLGFDPHYPNIYAGLKEALSNSKPTK